MTVISLDKHRAGASPTSLPAQTAGGSSPTESPADPYTEAEMKLMEAYRAVGWLYSTAINDKDFARVAFDNRDYLRTARDWLIEIDRWVCKPENRSDIEPEDFE